MDKLDLTKKYKPCFSAKTKPELVNIEPAQFISITGKGDPSEQDFASHIEAMYSTAYVIKFVFKAKDKDFVVSKLEALWWYDESKFKVNTIEEASTKIPRSEWEYKLLIRMPEYVAKLDVDAAQKVVSEKKIALASKVEFFEMNEGKCIHMLHVGPFSKEPESLMIIGEFVKEKQLQKNGLHHEIYLSDFRKTAPEKLKTILREPVK